MNEPNLQMSVGLLGYYKAGSTSKNQLLIQYRAPGYRAARGQSFSIPWIRHCHPTSKERIHVTPRASNLLAWHFIQGVASLSTLKGGWGSDV